MRQEIRAGVIDWVEQRSSREKLLLGVALVFAVVWLGFAAIWQPLRHHRADLETRIARYDRGLAALQNPGFSAPDPQNTIIDSRPVPVILTDSAAVFDVVIRRLEADGTGARLVLEEATFEQIILWLEALERDYSLHVTELEMTRRPGPGVVSTTLALER
jgi:general secretion pathway protein M